MPPREPNLFVYFDDRLRRQDDDQGTPRPERPGGWENALTEATAFYLSCDRDALVTVVERIAGSGDPPTSIGTQLRGVDGTPDLAIERASGKRLIIECKVDADLGDRQLERYLESLSPERGHLALVSRRRQRVPKAVMDSSLYRKPDHGNHFFWEDLHAWLGQRSAEPDTVLRGHFLRYLERLGFERMSPDVERLVGPRDDLRNRRQQESFGRKLARTCRRLDQEGFRVSAVSYKGLHAVPKSQTSYHHMVVWPASSRTAYVPGPLARLIPGAALVVGLVFDRGARQAAEALYRALPASFNDEDARAWVTIPPRVIGNQRVRLELVSSLDPFLEGGAAIEERIERGVTSVVHRVRLIKIVNSDSGVMRLDFPG
jgi:hypothetical protein